MKICRKCKKEYKNDYVYCPKCGTPCDKNIKAVNTPVVLINPIFSEILKICNAILYFIGGLLIFVYLGTIKESFFDSIFGIL